MDFSSDEVHRDSVSEHPNLEKPPTLASFSTFPALAVPASCIRDVFHAILQTTTPFQTAWMPLETVPPLGALWESPPRFCETGIASYKEIDGIYNALDALDIDGEDNENRVDIAGENNQEGMYVDDKSSSSTSPKKEMKEEKHTKMDEKD